MADLGDFSQLLTDGIYNYSKAAIEKKVNKAGAKSVPTQVPISNARPAPAAAAASADVLSQLRDIATSPRTWLVVVGIVGAVFIVKRMKRGR